MPEDATSDSPHEDARESVNKREGAHDDVGEDAAVEAAEEHGDEVPAVGDVPPDEAATADAGRTGTDAAEGHESEQRVEPSASGAAGAADPVAAAAIEAFDGLIFHDSRGQSVLYVPREQWVEVARWLRDEHDFETCVDLCGVDHLLNARRPVPAGVTPQRFEVVANFLSRRHNRRIRLICEVPAADPVMPSIAAVHPGADWAERETFDLFGVTFDGHPDLTRILLPDDWEGWPLRKDDAAARVPVAFKGPKTTPSQQELHRQSSRAVSPASPPATTPASPSAASPASPPGPTDGSEEGS